MDTWCLYTTVNTVYNLIAAVASNFRRRICGGRFVSELGKFVAAAHRLRMPGLLSAVKLQQLRSPDSNG